MFWTLLDLEINLYTVYNHNNKKTKSNNQNLILIATFPITRSGKQTAPSSLEAGIDEIWITHGLLLFSFHIIWSPP